jgi:UDP-N-acetylmuramate--alanine ligase
MDEADHIIVLPIYGAGEKSIMGLDHIALVKAIAQKVSVPVETVDNEKELAQKLEPLCQEGRYVLCMGAGSITKIAHDLEKNLHEIRGL